MKNFLRGRGWWGGILSKGGTFSGGILFRESFSDIDEFSSFNDPWEKVRLLMLVLEIFVAGKYHLSC